MKKGTFFLIVLAVFAMAVPGWAGEVDKEIFPFFPSLVNTSAGGIVPTSEFEDAKVCRACHPEIYKQ